MNLLSISGDDFGRTFLFGTIIAWRRYTRRLSRM
jgi:hypothetical protein